MKTTQTKIEFVRLPKDYAGLCRRLTPRPIHDKVEIGCHDSILPRRKSRMKSQFSMTH
ncbi:MAG: hypothetical protein ABSH48_00555 [Verrucomicrobiota bacterium]|jgi:hypothetical protein